MQDLFGDLLREQRIAARHPLSAIAQLLAVSIAYVSDVERSRRNPFSDDRIFTIARFLGADPLPLIEAARPTRAGQHKHLHSDVALIVEQAITQYANRPKELRENNDQRTRAAVKTASIPNPALEV